MYKSVLVQGGGFKSGLRMHCWIAGSLSRKLTLWGRKAKMSRNSNTYLEAASLDQSPPRSGERLALLNIIFVFGYPKRAGSPGIWRLTIFASRDPSWSSSWSKACDGLAALAPEHSPSVLFLLLAFAIVSGIPPTSFGQRCPTDCFEVHEQFADAAFW